MGSNSISKSIGVIGAGSFGSAVANLLAEKNANVLLFARNHSKAEKMASSRQSAGQLLSPHIQVTDDLEKVAKSCNVIFPIVPSSNFRSMVLELAPYLKPYHILIHGTKGFDIVNEGQKSKKDIIRKHEVWTMSEVIEKESSVVRVGCLAGPNLASEIAMHKPAAAVIASKFDEVVHTGQKLLKSDRFLIYGSNDIRGIELCGILKNIIALGAGMVNGLGLGENAKALFISRGLVEMVQIGKALGGNIQAFLGLAGVGDLIATCSSTHSRNYTVGNRLAGGEKITAILESMEEVAEGVRTIKIIQHLARQLKFRCPINETLYRVISGESSVQEAYAYLMKFPFSPDIDVT